MNAPQPISPGISASQQVANGGLRGRWKWGAGLLTVALIAQGILWTMWWGDPTHFKMSILFVWPAALFALSIWWLIFSGWSWLVRVGSLAVIAIGVIAFFSIYRLEWDGDMVPRRVVLRTKPTGQDVAREFFQRQKKQTAESATGTDAALASVTPALVAEEADWLGFRGPRRDGVVQNGSLRRDWTMSPPREIWRHPVGRAWSSFAVVGNFAFTQEQRDQMECVVAYAADTGNQIWVHEDPTILSIVDANGGPGPHATPQFDEGKLYTLGGTGILNCLEAVTGKLVWSKNILGIVGQGKTGAKPPEWGVSASPLIHGNLVIVISGGSTVEADASFNKGVTAYEKLTGEQVWSVGTHPASYGSPRVETIGDTAQLLIPNGNGLSGHSLDDGKELWFFPLENAPKVNSSMPWRVDENSLLFGTGYGVGTVRLDLKQADGQWNATRRWASNRFRPKFNDFVVREQFAYGLDDGTLTCLDVESGAIKWKSGRYGYGQLLLIDDVLLIISEDGDLMLIPAQPKKPDVLASFKLFDSGFCWNHLAFRRGQLFARNANEAACVDLSAENASQSSQAADSQ